MASAGANVNHIEHVSTQLPYALTVAAVSFVCYILAGILRNWMICLLIGAVLVAAVLFVLRGVQKKNTTA
jgi:Na+/H+ antiporter NhaC